MIKKFPTVCEKCKKNAVQWRFFLTHTVHTGRRDRLWNRPFSLISDLRDVDLDLGWGGVIWHTFV